jgi:hypothetical protein
MKTFYLSFLFLISQAIWAKTTIWTGNANTTAWATAANWSNGVPANGDSVYITRVLSKNPAYPAGTLSLVFLEVSASNNLTISASNRIINVNGNCNNYGTLTNSGNFTVNGNLTNYLGGTFTTPNGTTTINGNFINQSSASNAKNFIVNGNFIQNSLFSFTNSSSSNGLQIQGDLTGTGNISSTGTVYFNSTSGNQTISVNQFSTSLLIVNNTYSGGTITVRTNIDITTSITLTAGILNIDNANSGDLNINLDNVLINQTGAGSITGDITLSRTINNPKSHYFAPILDGVTMQEIHDQYEVMNPSTNLTRLHKYENGTWTGVNNYSTVLDKDGAYSIFLLQSNLNDNSNTIFLQGSYTHMRNKTFNFSDNSSVKYYLVPNIYPNTLLWGSTTKSNLTGKIYYWDPAQTAYQMYNANTSTGTLGGTNNIGAMQAFFVETNGNGSAASLTQNTSHVGASSTALRRTVAVTPLNQFKLLVTNTQTGSMDELLIHFNEYGKLVYDTYDDAIKFMNPSPTPNIYVKKENSQLVMSNYPSINNQTDTTLKLFIKTANTNNYKLQIIPLGDVDSYLNITLEDTLNNYKQDFLNNTTYFFKGQTNGVMSLNLNLGSLSKTAVTTDIVQSTSFYNDNTLHIQTNKSLTNATVRLINTAGALVATYTNVDLTTGVKEINTNSITTGIYLLKIESSDYVTTHKLVVE